MRSSLSGIRVLFFFAVLSMLCIPGLAYSEEASRWFDQGNGFVQSGNTTLAVEAYNHAIELEPGFYEAWDGKADALNRDGQFSEALAASSRSLEINNSYVRGWINRGQILYNIGYYYEDQVHNTVKADEYYRQQILAFDKAIQLEPGNAEAWFNKGYALAGMKRYDEAIAAFDHVQSLDPAYPKLELSQKQVRVLRDAATPVYVRYALPLIGVFLILAAIIAGYWYWRSSAVILEPSPESRQRWRKKED
jgi:tetratricopeptide (TPR) repeat protein